MPVPDDVRSDQLLPLYAHYLSQDGKGAFPFAQGQSRITRASLGRSLTYGSARPAMDGNNLNFAGKFFFRLSQSGTSGRGSGSLFTGSGQLLNQRVTRESLVRQQGWASRDYALRKVMDDWFFAASPPFGRPVIRARTLQDAIADTGGILGWGFRSPLVTRESLTRDLHYANGGTTLQTKMEDWFFGKTTGSADIHILYTLGRYA